MEMNFMEKKKDGVCFDPLNPELDIVKVREEHDFEEEPAIKNELSSANEEEASNTDRQDVGLTMKRFDGEECVKEEEIFVKSEFGSCAGYDDSALVDNNDEEEASNTDRQDAGLTMKRFDREECVKEEEVILNSEFGSCAGSDDSALEDNNDEDGVCFDPLKPELDIVKFGEEHDFEEETAELSSVDEEEASNTDRQDAGSTMRLFDGEKCVNDSALEDNNDGEKPVACKNCDYRTSHPSALRRHFRSRHTGEKPYPCKLCDYKATRAEHLSRHMRTHTGEKPYACELCNYKANRPENLSNHMRTHTGEKPYPCTLCNYKATQPGDLSAHMRTHSGEKPYACKLCNYKATQLDHLSRHMRTHTGEKPYSCKLCDYKATQLAALARHKRIHTGEKPYSCKLCNYKANQLGSLSRHMRTHTGEKPYSCKLCNYKASQMGSLSAHMRTHTGEKPSKCRRDMIRTHPKAPPLPLRMSLRSKTSDSIQSIESSNSSGNKYSKGQRPVYAESISSDTELDDEP